MDKPIGPDRVALYAARRARLRSVEPARAGDLDWVAPDEALPEHPSPECETELWLLTHPDARHLRRVGAVYAHLSQAIRLP